MRESRYEEEMMRAENIGDFQWKMTFYMIICWILAAFGGLMFGYDIGITGGVTGMDDFLIEFFPRVYKKKSRAKEDNYCKYDDQFLQLFTSSLYLAALVSSFAASKMCSKFGRKPTILFGSLLYLSGSGMSAGARNHWMIIVGRVLLGLGVGFGNEAVPLFLSEIAPQQWRGAVNVLFNLFITIGILVANLVNFTASRIRPYGWRLSLGFAGIPSAILFLGSLVITETPTSLVERGKEEQGRRALEKIRGIKRVDLEFDQIKLACEAGRKIEHLFRKLLDRSSVPPLVIGIMFPMFQQFTGISAIGFYGPILLQTVGFKNSGALLSVVIMGTVNMLSSMLSVYTVDRLGRRKLLLHGSVQIFVCLVIIGVLLLVYMKPEGPLQKGQAVAMVILICLFVWAFGWSWGPLAWLIPSEIFPLETRTVGFAFTVSANMLMTFLITQTFLSMMCLMRAYIFFFFAAWILVMGLFVHFLLPETKNIPIDATAELVWKRHPFWKRFMD